MTDWWGEISSTRSPSQAVVPAQTDWYKEVTTPSARAAPSVRQDTPNPASIGTSAVASLADDPKAQIRYYAKQRGIPEDRYQVINNQVAFRGDDGGWYAEIPKNWGPSDIVRRVAAGTGPAIPVVAGAVAGIASSPMLLTGPVGLAGSMAITGGAGAAGQAGREYLANQIMGQDVNPWRIATEGGTAALGQGIGGGMTAWANRNAAEDIKQLDKVTMSALRNKAQQQGISLTPAEESGLASLKAQQKYVGNAPRSQNIMQDFYQNRGQQVEGAIENYLGRMSPIDSGEVAGAKATQAAKDAVLTARKQFSKAVEPYYTAASYGPDGKPLKVPQEAVSGKLIDRINEILDVAPENDVLRQVRNLFFQKNKDAAGSVLERAGQPVLKTRIDQLHETKTTIDDILEAQDVGSRSKSIIKGLKDELVDRLGSASPAYEKGRAYATEIYPNRSAVTDGMTGIIAETKPENYGAVAQKLFGGKSGPDTIQFVRAQLQRESPEAWQGIKRAWLDDVFAQSAKQFASNYGDTPNVAGKFAAAIKGDMKTTAKLKAALEPTEYRALMDLSDVLKAAGSVKPIGSDTAWNQLIVEAEKSKARPLVAKIIGNANPAQLMRNADDWLTNRAMGKQAEDIARIITQPGAAEQLKQLKMLSPRSVQFRVILGHIIGQGSAIGAGSMLDAAAPLDNEAGQ